MWDTFLRSGDLSTIVFWGLLIIGGLAALALSTWRKHQATKMEHELKMEMVSRGMSADEIERVLAAKSSSVKDPSATDSD